MDQDNQVHAHNQDEKEAQVKAAVEADVTTEAAADGTLSENDLDQVAGGGFGSIMKLSNIRSDW